MQLTISTVTIQKLLKVKCTQISFDLQHILLQLSLKRTYSWSNSLAYARDKSRHAFLRRIMNPSFSPNSLKALEPTLNRYYNDFLNGIEQASLNDGIVEMNEWFHNLSFDVSVLRQAILTVIDCWCIGSWIRFRRSSLWSNSFLC